MAGARPILIWSLVIAVGLAIAWLWAGRPILLVLDRVLTVRVSTLPVSPLVYKIADLNIGGRDMPLIGTDNELVKLRFQTDALNRLVLFDGDKSFTLGLRTAPPDPSGRPDTPFQVDPGDMLTFTSRRSFLSRRAPYQINVMGGSSPKWMRYVYYQLMWKKPSGATLEMTWRFEQWYYAERGWTDANMTYDFYTGLIRVKLTPEFVPQEDAVVKYIAQTKGWKRADYRIENRGLSPDGRSDVLAVIHLKDECCSSPGAGMSVELYVDRTSRQVTKELGYQ